MPELAGEGRMEKRLRVAREGQTVDGRELDRQEILDMAVTYNMDHYAGRINVEHFKGFSPEPPFNAYGDVIKVEAIEEDGKMCLYNTISALPNLVEINKKGQKLYPSIEFYRNFAGSGKAYQVGLGFTDEPNSLGTEPLKFSVNKNALRTVPDKEIFMTTETQQNDNKSLLQQIKDLMTPQPPQKVEEDDFQKTVSEGLVTAFNQIRDLGVQLGQIQKDIQKLSVQPNASTPPAADPATTPPPATPANTNNPMTEAFNAALQPITQQIQQLQQQFNVISHTPVNQPPPGTGAAGDATPY